MTMRLGGLSSGIDVQGMIDQMMRVERMKVDRYLQQEQRTQWRQEGLHDMTKSLANFLLDARKDFGLNQVTYTGQFRATNVDQFNWVKSARSSNTTAVTATANANAMQGTHQVQVKQLAEVARTNSLNLKDVQVGGEDLLKADGYTFNLSGEDTQNLEINGETFTVKAGDTVFTLVNQINRATDADGKSLGLSASYDREVGSLMISSRTTGANQKIDIGVGGLGSAIFEADDRNKTGKDAEITFNGLDVKRSTNNFSVYGINLNLKETTLVEGTTDEYATININVNTNVDGIVDKIKGFVDQYNGLLDLIGGKTSEAYHQSYAPLTDEQKLSMTERDIEQWEEKSKSGLLRNDETLTRMVQNMRGLLYEPVKNTTGTFNQITQIGITTGNFRDGGRLVIDEDKLREAIAADADGVMNLIFKTSDATDSKERSQNSGLFQRINDEIVIGMKDLVRRGGTGENASLYRSVQGNMLIDYVTKNSSRSLMDRELSTLNTRIAREEQALFRKEEAYWKRFTAMEKALSELNNQASWLGAHMGAM
ncbi:flagellar filament capping protein FliD [Anoxynatronum buryatiense]|uniref:Flagellar hook-associated protein 2 n=1 Tax=Anoxynatronum buryatiense TaxID=489973 RepID=A0AA46AK94_9CLOT|nr:flagellar filament capping protein FliD [Anoxynatronum buryatiense]SMP67413.1 flagellar hook-associated protein 2 [Anoxynatronum buryatiense]